jgi:hypothetical protein
MTKDEFIQHLIAHNARPDGDEWVQVRESRALVHAFFFNNDDEVVVQVSRLGKNGSREDRCCIFSSTLPFEEAFGFLE